jgi:1-acyl-sn-glycerol-3-phosphate acyltransferase
VTFGYRMCWAASKVFYKVVGRTRIIGHSNIPTTGPFIVASNHVSYLDPPLVGSCIKRECAYMARHDLWKSPVLGWFMDRSHAFPVHRDSADRAAIRHALAVLKVPWGLVLFPEGTRSPDGNLQPAEGGLALIVQKSGAPVVPCALIGPEAMWPPGAKRLKPTQITVVFGEPLVFGPETSRETMMARVMQGIADLLTANGRPMKPAA